MDKRGLALFIAFAFISSVGIVSAQSTVHTSSYTQIIAQKTPASPEISTIISIDKCAEIKTPGQRINCFDEFNREYLATKNSHCDIIKDALMRDTCIFEVEVRDLQIIKGPSPIAFNPFARNPRLSSR